VHLHRLEARGYVTRRREGYRVTRRGRRELAMVMAIARLRP
jgi:DNA-binding PadR family transcriptional regulator